MFFMSLCLVCVGLFCETASVGVAEWLMLLLVTQLECKPIQEKRIAPYRCSFMSPRACDWVWCETASCSGEPGYHDSVMEMK
jgi:hypothetical protein